MTDSTERKDPNLIAFHYLLDYEPDHDNFTLHLAAWCSQWIMEIAQPIMEHADELEHDKALCMLLDKWFDADTKYRHSRNSYLVQYAHYKAEGYDFEPSKAYEWAYNERKAYNEALQSLLVR